MSDTRTITNNVPRDIIEAWELTPKERAEFDYLDWDAIEAGNDSASFFRYRDQLYDLGEFETTSGSGNPDLRAWHGFHADSYFSAVVIRYVDDNERVIVGTILS